MTLAGVLTLPLLLPDGSAFPARDLVIFIAAAVILCSLLAASLLLPVVLKGLELPADDSERQEEDLAMRMSSKAALAAGERSRQELVQGQSTGNVQLFNDAAARVSLLYQRNLARGLNNPDGDPEQVARMERGYRQLRNAGLNAEREELFRRRRLPAAASTARHCRAASGSSGCRDGRAPCRPVPAPSLRTRSIPPRPCVHCR